MYLHRCIDYEPQTSRIGGTGSNADDNDDGLIVVCVDDDFDDDDDDSDDDDDDDDDDENTNLLLSHSWFRTRECVLWCKIEYVLSHTRTEKV